MNNIKNNTCLRIYEPAHTNKQEGCGLRIVARNDRNGNPLKGDIRITSQNLPELQEMINKLYRGHGKKEQNNIAEVA